MPFRAGTEEQAGQLIDEVAKEHPKSRHVCYAYRVGIKAPLERTQDAGEPSNTAGKPILGQIHSNDLDNTLIVVVRYFGGTLLGVSGLINAYKAAAAHAIHHNNIITVEVKAIYELAFDYEDYYELMDFIKKEEIILLSQQMDIHCKMKASVPISKKELFIQKIDTVKTLRYTFQTYE